MYLTACYCNPLRGYNYVMATSLLYFRANEYFLLLVRQK